MDNYLSIKFANFIGFLLEHAKGDDADLLYAHMKTLDAPTFLILLRQFAPPGTEKWLEEQLAQSDEEIFRREVALHAALVPFHKVDVSQYDTAALTRALRYLQFFLAVATETMPQ